MANLRAAALTVGLVVASHVLAYAQGPGTASLGESDPKTTQPGMPATPISPTTITGFGIGTENPLLFLLAPAVQNELKLKAEQKARVNELAVDGVRKAIELRQSMFFKGGNLNTFMKSAERLRRESDRLVAKVLEKEQNERLRQIVRQVEGLLATSRPEIASELKLDAKQSRSIEAIMQELFLRQRQTTVQFQVAVANGQLPAENLVDQTQRAAAQTRAEAAAMIGRLLNEKQTAAFQEMLGKPFDVTTIEPDLNRLARDLTARPTRSRAKSRDPRKSSAAARKAASGKAAPPAEAGRESEKDSAKGERDR